MKCCSGGDTDSAFQILASLCYHLDLDSRRMRRESFNNNCSRVLRHHAPTPSVADAAIVLRYIIPALPTLLASIEPISRILDGSARLVICWASS
jgi:hypothetical protein